MRNSKIITLTEKDKDENGNIINKDIVFEITQMGAVQQERFIIKLAVLIGGGVDISEIDFSNFSLQSLKSLDNKTVLSSLSKIDPEKVYPLLDELLVNVKRVVGNVKHNVTNESLEAMGISLMNLWELRKEVLKISFDFFPKDNMSTPAVTIPKSKGNAKT